MNATDRVGPPISEPEALQLVSHAVLRANEIYIRMSGGLTLHESGIEPVISNQIAGDLFEAGRARGRIVYATLETTFAKVQEWSGSSPMRGAKPLALRRNGRVDVVYFDDSGERSMGVVEVKRHFSWSAMKDDIDRIASLLRRHGSPTSGVLRWGCVVGFHTENRLTKKPGQVRLLGFEQKLREYLKAHHGEPTLLLSHCESRHIETKAENGKRLQQTVMAPALLFSMA